MSSSSDIEKLFEQFGGDANAYQEIGRENDARTARTRWPLLVTLDLAQPAIPEIGQVREAKPQSAVSAAPVAAPDPDNTPKDVAAVTRAKAPLFTRSHRRDIPPAVVAPEKPAMPSGASWRFGAADQADQDGAQAASGVAPTLPAQRADAAEAMSGAQAAPTASSASAAATAPASTSAGIAAVAPAAAFTAAPAASPIPPAMPPTPFAPIPPVAGPAQQQVPPAAAPAWFASSAAPAAPIPLANPSSAFHFRAPPAQPAASAAPDWARASTPMRLATNSMPIAPGAPATSTQFAPPLPAAQPQQPQQPPSILGKLFAPTSSASQPSAGSTRESAPLQSVFDRLRATPARGAAASAGTSGSSVPGTSNGWLTNGPRRS
ncbi:cellulose biosynthesis protein BcsP [Paraburkholderia sp. ZP32-5]|uniref:cellulose biosynthesis protein BcsP n=1 Tax=Paraburkholderia sp. ZP32-5 TaxID=2883245 RepID=UPI001EF39D8A|nr:cellulose biosynthesis protein BcsP [Paraburkholderia sp. ZP32-5]